MRTRAQQRIQVEYVPADLAACDAMIRAYLKLHPGAHVWRGDGGTFLELQAAALGIEPAAGPTPAQEPLPA